jgi:hypothetical protein
MPRCTSSSTEYSVPAYHGVAPVQAPCRQRTAGSPVGRARPVGLPIARRSTTGNLTARGLPVSGREGPMRRAHDANPERKAKKPPCKKPGGCLASRANGSWKGLGGACPAMAPCHGAITSSNGFLGSVAVVGCNVGGWKAWAPQQSGGWKDGRLDRCLKDGRVQVVQSSLTGA